jgi:hypothetical protein
VCSGCCSRATNSDLAARSCCSSVVARAPPQSHGRRSRLAGTLRRGASLVRLDLEVPCISTDLAYRPNPLRGSADAQRLQPGPRFRARARLIRPSVHRPICMGRFATPLSCPLQSSIVSSLAPALSRASFPVGVPALVASILRSLRSGCLFRGLIPPRSGACSSQATASLPLTRPRSPTFAGCHGAPPRLRGLVPRGDRLSSPGLTRLRSGCPSSGSLPWVLPCQCPVARVHP